MPGRRDRQDLVVVVQRDVRVDHPGKTGENTERVEACYSDSDRTILFVICYLVSICISIVRFLIIIDMCTIVRLLYTPMLYILVRQEI